MDRAEIEVDAAPADVWAVLADAETFAEWVVGCKEIRAVEGDWPTPGSKIHHTVGVGSATIEDTTSVLEAVPDEHLTLRARARPAGVAGVEITLSQSASGTTTIVMEEEVVDGPASHLPDALTDTLLHPRNLESLRRLKRLAEERAHGG